jgi:hypothetical protein
MKKSPLFRSIGVLLALLVSVALQNSLAGPCPQSCAPTWEFYYGISPAPNYVELETIYPSNASIFYTVTFDGSNADPTHDGSGNPTGSTLKVPNGTHVGLAYGHESFFRMLAWRSDKGDSPIVAFSQQNPP